jgi:hypothetical protein
MSSSSPLLNAEKRAAIPSDTFSIRDLWSWNPFHQQQRRTTTNSQKNDNKENGGDDDDANDDHNITYDNHWILILNGSYKGYFDWVPIHLRTGGWAIMATFYFRTLWCLSVLLIMYDLSYNKNHSRDGVFDDAVNVCSISTNESNAVSETPQSCHSLTTPSSFSFSNILHLIVRRYWTHNASTILQMSPVIMLSSSFYYNTAVAAYMTYICYSIIAHSPLSYGAWITYTVQSWTLLLIRHLLYTLSGLFDSSTTGNNNNFIVMAELIRFPCAVAHTMTFIVWNFVLVPYILFVALRNDKKKRHDFIRFCTNFRLFNLHGMNILFCVANVWYFNGNAIGTSAIRTFEMADLYFSGISAFMYFTFYLCILDRIGIHLYPIFSPRHSNAVVFIVWTSVILLYVATFQMWQYVINM